jgi:tetratricopeptide (TPR) repeat protein
LHELVHHFLWRAGFSPDFFLWFHEGIAQFVSVETIISLGYPGGTIEKEWLEEGADWFERYGEDFEFLQGWKPTVQPVDVSTYYVASYYVVSRLAEKYKRQDKLDLYERFFKRIHGLKYEPYDWNPTEWLAFYLSMAANASVDLTLKHWGFNIRLFYTASKISPDLIWKAEKAIDSLSPVFQPYKLIAEFLYQQALLRLERGDIEGATQLLNIAISLANIAPLLTLLTLIVIFAVIAYILFKYTSKPSEELPPLPPTYPHTGT